jgi:hypothetical protein
MKVKESVMVFRMMTGAAAVLLLAGCTLADVTVPPSEDRLVVEAVLRTDLPLQSILLHRSVRDGTSAAEPGAEVEVTGPGGLRMIFHESAEPCYTIDPKYGPEQPVQVDGTCYMSPETVMPWVQPGATYDLTVRTTRGEEARARTTVPGTFQVYGIPTVPRNDVNPPPCALPPQVPLPVSWTPSSGAWGYLAPLTIYGLSGAVPGSLNPPDPMELLGVSVSASDTTLVLPGEFGVFERFQYNQDLMRLLQEGLPDGTSARVVVAAADRNYINGVRGGNFNPSGQVRISSILGDGVGVFGSLTPLSFAVDVDRTQTGLPSCVTP